MIKHIKIFLLLFGLVFTSCVNKKHEVRNYTDLVDPFIGTAGGGNTFPGVTLPFGMVQLSPDTHNGDGSSCGGYDYTAHTIVGFSHTHLSGTGSHDYGDILFMPTVGKLQFQPGSSKNPDSGYRSRFDHSDENAEPGYYSVRLLDYNINAELTATKRVGFHRYTFPKSDSSNIIIDLDHAFDIEDIADLYIKIINDTEIEGLRRSRGWADDQYVYFAAEFSKPFKSFGVVVNGNEEPGSKYGKGKSVKAYVRYSTGTNEKVMVKVGISAVSTEGAWKNLKAEIPGWNFDEVRAKAKETWTNELNKIQVEGGTVPQRVTFYTALYHALMSPNLFMDVDGRYRGIDHKIHTAKGFENYTIFSLWDTFRAEHPLFTIIEKEKTNQFIKTLLAKYEEGGELPLWELAGNYTGMMIGYHAVPVIVDAYMKGIRGYDVDEAYKAIKHSAELDKLGLKYYKNIGFVPADEAKESVSKTLEYAYDDWCISRMAKSIGNHTDYLHYLRRSQFYKDLFDTTTDFMRGKNYNGTWVEPFDPYSPTREYTESNAWQYNLFVPQDVDGLIDLFGGEDHFIKRLDEIFAGGPKQTGQQPSTTSGRIGEYIQGNEPSHHMAYLYNYAGAQWKTQERVKEIMQFLYSDKPNGLSGNDDCGQMSAWYIFSAMGFYPVCPGNNTYEIGVPMFDKVTINLENGNQFIISTVKSSEHDQYVQAALLNGKKYTKTYIKHSDIESGGEITFAMGSVPSMAYGVDSSDRPHSLIDTPVVAIPSYKTTALDFLDNTTVSLDDITGGSEIFYTVDGSEPSKLSTKYDSHVTVNKTVDFKAAAFKNNFHPSYVLNLKLNKMKLNPPAVSGGVSKGLNYQYYEGDFRKIADFINSKPVKTGVTNNLSLSAAQREDHFAFHFYGYIKIEKDGIYDFYLSSDDGSRLLIDDKQFLDNDGSHASLTVHGKIGLQKGYHKVDLYYFEDYGGQRLKLEYKMPGGNRKPFSPDHLYH